MLPLKTLTTEARQPASHNSKVMSSFSWKAWHPKQHCNRCLNHFFPAYSGNPFKGSRISLPYQLQMGTFGFLLIYFLTFLSKVSRIFFPIFSTCCRSPQAHEETHWQRDLSSPPMTCSNCAAGTQSLRSSSASWSHYRGSCRPRLK